jgi:hypothetical protein
MRTKFNIYVFISIGTIRKYYFKEYLLSETNEIFESNSGWNVPGWFFRRERVEKS